MKRIIGFTLLTILVIFSLFLLLNWSEFSEGVREGYRLERQK